MRQRVNCRSIVFAAVLCMGLWGLTGCRLGGFTVYKVNGDSMEPTLYPGHNIVVSTGYYSYHPIRQGEMIAYRREDSVLVKRVGAVPGDTIEGRQGVIFRNGQKVDEPYVAAATPGEEDTLRTFAPIRVQGGEIFVLGDNRAHSLDSRSTEYGSILIKDLAGRVVRYD